MIKYLNPKKNIVDSVDMYISSPIEPRRLQWEGNCSFPMDSKMNP
ncbi:MAG: hypothetical protein ACYCZW_03945 [Minisyncoccota bacterium]